MIRFYNFFIVVVVVLLVLSCNGKKNGNTITQKNGEPDFASLIVTPKAVKIIHDSIKSRPANGELVYPVTLSFAETRSFIFPDLSSILSKKTKSKIFSQKVDIKESQLIHYFPGENGLVVPLRIKIPDEKQEEQQDGRIIYPPAVIPKKEIRPVKAAPAAYKENAIHDLQYFDEFSGMHSSSVLTMLEDRRGFLWIGTLQGLIRYDGVTFIQYSTSNGLINDVVSSLFEDSKGKIWFGTSLGLGCYDGQSFTHYTQAQGLAHNEITSITEDNNGVIWIGTRNGINQFDGSSFVHYSTKQGLIGDEVSTLLVDKTGKIWIGTSDGVCSFDGKSFIHYPFGKNGETASVSSMQVDKNGKIWIGYWDGGLSCFDGKELIFCNGNADLNSLIILSIHQDKDGILWLGTFGQGVICFDGNKFSQFTTNEGLVHNSVNSVIEDSSGKLWFGTLAGINCLNNHSFVNYTKNQGLPYNQVLSFAEGDNNELLLGTYGEIALYTNDSVFNIPVGNEAGDISALLKDKKGRLWLGSESGIFCYKDGLLRNFQTKNGLVNNWVSDIKEDKNGNFWIATWGGVSFYNDSVFINYTKENGLGSNSISSVFIDNTGKVWFGTMGDGILSFDGKSFINFNSSNGLDADKITSIVQDNSGNIWFGSSGNGLFCYNGTSFLNFTTQHGICSDFIESLIFDDKNRLWIATQNGISLLVYEVNSKHFQANDEYHFYNFGQQDGLRSKKYGLNAVFLDSKNRLWWGGQKGLTMIDLNRFNIQQEKPKLQLNTIEIQQQFIDYAKILNKKPSEQITIGSIVSKKRRQLSFSEVEKFNNYPLDLELNYRLNELGFHFFAIDWQAPHKLKYQYNLDGFDKSWSFFSTDNRAIYKNLPAGDYSFKVRAVGAANRWSNVLRYDFVINPPWWLTWWAKVIYVLLFFSMVGAYIRLRVASLKKSKRLLEQKVKERTEEVELQKEELQQQNEEIKAINATLNEQKLIIEIRNESLSLQNEKILEQRDLLAKQHNAINESILYAKQIQTAVMPKKKLLDDIMPENFILFRPRNVVSGDFYWVRKIREFVIIIVADCTGHGVPGAFMSMLGISILNEIVWNRKITKANQALNELRKHVKYALEQTGERGEIDDGMDLVLCVLDTKTNELQYAGANNSLYLISEGNFKEIKADKMPIGYYPNEKPSFTNHKIQLQKGDTIYLFTDGFMDQFGGKKGFKYMAANFQQLLLEINIRSMDVQKILLEEELEKWMEGWEQTDDILVMGVRV